MNIDGKLSINSKQVNEFVKDKMPEHKPYWFSLVPQGDVRSIEFNAYYWGHVLKTISNDSGYWPDELHEMYKEMFNPIVVKKVDIESGKVIEERRGDTTTKLSTKKFAEYIERIKAHAVETFGAKFDIFEFWIASHPDEVEHYAQRMR